MHLSMSTWGILLLARMCRPAAAVNVMWDLIYHLSSVIVVNCLAGGEEIHTYSVQNAGTSTAKGLRTITLTV